MYCVFVASTLREPCLLGADILTASHAGMDFHNSEITVLGQKLKLQKLKLKSAPSGQCCRFCKISRVAVAETILVPAGSEIIMPATVVLPKCSVNSTCHQYGIVEGRDEYVKQSDLCVARLAVTVQDGSVPVRVSNLSDMGITLNKGTHIAEFEGLDDSAFGASVGTEAEFQVDSAVSHLGNHIDRSSQISSPATVMCSLGLVGQMWQSTRFPLGTVSLCTKAQGQYRVTWLIRSRRSSMVSWMQGCWKRWTRLGGPAPW